MDCSTPGLSIHHQLPEFTQTHIHWVSDVNEKHFPKKMPKKIFLQQDIILKILTFLKDSFNDNFHFRKNSIQLYIKFIYF